MMKIRRGDLVRVTRGKWDQTGKAVWVGLSGHYDPLALIRFRNGSVVLLDQHWLSVVKRKKPRA